MGVFVGVCVCGGGGGGGKHKLYLSFMNISLFNYCSLSVNGHCEVLAVHLKVRYSLLLTLSLPLAPSSNL